MRILAQILFVFVILSLFIGASSVSTTTPSWSSCDVVIYRVLPDGSVNVTYIVTVNDVPAKILLPVDAPPIYADAEIGGFSIPVEYNDTTISLEVYENGTITLHYITLELTSKSGEYWSLTIRPICTAYLILPEEAIPLNFSTEPDVKVIGNDVVFVFPPGTHTIYYVSLAVFPATATTTYTMTPVTSTSTPTTTPTETTSTSSTATSPESYPVTTTPYRTTSEQSKTDMTPIIIVTIIVVAMFASALLYARRKKGNSDNIVIDERDKAIISALKDGPKTGSELIEITKIPKTPLYRRLKKLINAGIIEQVDLGGAETRFRVF